MTFYSLFQKKACANKHISFDSMCFVTNAMRFDMAQYSAFFLV